MRKARSAKLESGKSYRGLNVILLGITGFANPFWGTFKQWSDMGAPVKKGEKATSIVFWKRISKTVTAEDRDGNQVEKEKAFFFLAYYNVFNMDQVNVTEAKLPKKVREYMAVAAAPVTEDQKVKSIEAAEELWASYKNKPTTTETLSDRAFYQPSNDSITVPHRNQYKDLEEFYSTLFHEGVHSTGHSTRLNRPTLVNHDGFGGHNYSEEELVAEFGASFLCGVSGIDRVVNNSAAYIKSWKDRIQADPRLVLRAASTAQTAVDYMTGIALEYPEEQSC